MKITKRKLGKLFIEKIRPVFPFIDTVQISTDGVGDTYETISYIYNSENPAIWPTFRNVACKQ